MFSLICARPNVWVNNRDAGDLRRHHAHYDVTVMIVLKWDKSHYFGNYPGALSCSPSSVTHLKIGHNIFICKWWPFCSGVLNTVPVKNRSNADRGWTDIKTIHNLLDELPDQLEVGGLDTVTAVHDEADFGTVGRVTYWKVIVVQGHQRYDIKCAWFQCPHGIYINGLKQKWRNSIALAMELSFLH